MLRKLNPDLRIERCWELSGGTAAAVTGIEATRPGGHRTRLVLRSYGSADVAANPRIATTEYQVMARLHAAGLPVPKPFLADESGTIMAGPWLLAEHADGSPLTSPPAPAGFTRKLAAVLARVHHTAIARDDVTGLPEMRDVAASRLGRIRASLDHALSEPAIRSALAANGPPIERNPAVLLHGDYWPGNTLWLDGDLVAVIDWENAARGDPLADVGNARLELAMLFGAAAQNDFTTQYRTLMPGLDFSALPYWDLYAALRPTGAMADWGLPPAALERAQHAHREFTAAALRQG
jgi:aminoglycoside phosphotransferase (APT) family kinase protein